MAEENCGSCVFFKDRKVRDEWAGQGVCRRYPPVPNFRGENARVDDAVWPMVRDFHWCGEWRAYDTAIDQSRQ